MIDIRTAKTDRQRLGGTSWGVWAERAVVRALEIDPALRIRGTLLDNVATCQVALMIARSVGYLGGTQRAPELPGEVRAWLDGVTLSAAGAKGACLSGLPWGEWAERAALRAMELDPYWRVEGALMRGQHLWKVAIVIARSIAFLAGTQRAPELPKELRAFLLGAPRLLTTAPTAEVAQ